MALETTRFDIQDHIKTDEAQAGFLEAVIEENDPDFLAVALGDVARARGVSAFSRETGISRETIYKTFKAGGNPTLETIAKALRPLSLRLALQPMSVE